jgi:hypothetical protein
MLESVVSRLLERILGEYVEGFQAGNVNLSLFTSQSGITLKNLAVKRDAINRLLALPMRVLHGSVGRIELTIPWTSLGSSPTVVRISDVFVLAGPNVGASDSAELAADELLQDKRRQVALLDESDRTTLRASASVAPAAAPVDDVAGASFTQRTVAKVIANLQVFVETVHVRYEDATTDPSAPFALGVTLDGVVAQACSATGEPAAANVLADVIHKLVQLRNLSIYWNSMSPPLRFSSVDELTALLRRSTASADHLYLLQPLSASVQLAMKRSWVPDMDVPKFAVSFDFRELELELNDAQYRDVQRVAAFASLWAKRAPYREQWRRAHAAPVSLARQRWLFVTSAVLHDVQARRRQYTWASMRAFVAKRRAFVALHTLWLEDAPPKGDAFRDAERAHGTTMAKLVDELPLSDIVFLRALALMLFRRSGGLARLRSRLAESTKKPAAVRAASDEPAAEGGSWFGRMFASSKSKKEASTRAAAAAAVADATPPAAPAMQLTESEWREVSDTLGWSDDDAGAAQARAPAAYVFLRVTGRLRSGGARLVTCDEQRRKRAVAHVKWDDFALSVVKRPTSLSLEGSLGSLLALDCVTDTPLFPSIVARLDGVAGASAEQPLLSFAVDLKPLDKPVDVFVKFAMQPLLVVYNFAAIDAVVGFFDATTTGERRHGDDALALKSAALARLSSMRRETQQRLLLAIADQTTLGIDVDVVAPRVVAPLSVRRGAAPFVAAVFDFGHLRFRSREPSASLPAIAPGESAAKAEERDEFYDVFELEISALNCGLTDQLDVKAYKSLFEPLSLRSQIQVCKVRSGSLLTLARVRASLTQVHLRLSAPQINTLMRIASTLTRQVGARGASADAAALKVALAQDGASAADNAAIDVATLAREHDGDAELLARATLLKFSFEADSTRLSLLADDAAELLVVDLKRLQLDVVKRTFDVRVDARLSAIDVTDRFQTYGERFAQLVVTPAGRGGAADASDFIALAYSHCERQSPFFEQLDHAIDLNVARALDVSLNRVTIDRMLAFASSALSGLGAAAAAPASPESTAADATLAQLGASRLVVSVTAKVRGASLLLHQGRLSLARFSVGQLAAQLRSSGSGAIDVCASVKSVQLDNLSAGVVLAERRRVLYATGDEVLNVRLTLQSPASRKRADADNVRRVCAVRDESADPTPLEPDGSIAVRVSSMQLLVLSDFFVQLLQYAQSLSGAMASAPPPPASGSSAPLTKFIFKFAVDLSELTVVVPALEKKRDELCFDLGTCHIANSVVAHARTASRSADLALVEQRFNVAIRKMNVVARLPSIDAAPERVIDTFDIEIDVAMAQAFRAAPKALRAARRLPMHVVIDVTPVRTRFDTDQLNLLFDVVHLNLCQLPATADSDDAADADRDASADGGDDEQAARERRRHRRRRRRVRAPTSGTLPAVMGAGDDRDALLQSAVADVDAMRGVGDDDDDELNAEPYLDPDGDSDDDAAVLEQRRESHPLSSKFETMRLELAVAELTLTIATTLHHKDAAAQMEAVGGWPDCLTLTVRALALDMHSLSDNCLHGVITVDAMRLSDARSGEFAQRPFRDLIAEKIGANERRDGAMLSVKFGMSQSADNSVSTQEYTVDVSDVALIVLPDVLNEATLWLFPFLEDLTAALDAYKRFRLALSRSMRVVPVQLGPPLVRLTADVSVRRARFALVEAVDNADSFGFVGAFVLDLRYVDEQRRDAATERTQRTQTATMQLTADISKCILREAATTALPIAPQFNASIRWTTGVAWRRPTPAELAHGVLPPLHQTDPTLLSLSIGEVLDLTLSYRDVRLAQLVLQSFAAYGQGAPPRRPSSSAAAAAASGIQVDARTVFNVDMRGIDVTLVNDIDPERHTPLLCVVLRPSHISMRDWHIDDLKTRVAFDAVRIDCFNAALRGWEPLLESCLLELTQRRLLTSISAPQTLQLTVTKSFLDTAMTSAALLAAPDADPSRATAEQRRKHHAAGLRLRRALRASVTVENATEFALRVWVGDAPAQAVQAGAAAAIDVKVRRESQGGARAPRRAAPAADAELALQVDVAEPALPRALAATSQRVPHLPLLHGDGRYLVALCGATAAVLAQLELRTDEQGGLGKIATLSSPLAVRNDMAVPLELRGELPPSVTLPAGARGELGSERVWSHVLMPQKSVSVPLLVYAYGSLAVRPAPIAGDAASHGFSRAVRAGDGLLAPRVATGAADIRALGASVFVPMYQLRCPHSDDTNPNALDFFVAVAVQFDSVKILNATAATPLSALAMRMTLAAPYVVTNALPLPLQLRWLCRASSTALFESEVGVGESVGVCSSVNPHWVALAPDREPKLAWKRRGGGAQALSVQLPNFKWSDDAAVIRSAETDGDLSFAENMARSCAMFTNVVDFFQRTLRLRIAVQCRHLSVHITLYADVWLVNRIGLPLALCDTAGRSLATSAIDLAGMEMLGLASGSEPRDWYVGGFAGDAPPMLASSGAVRIRVADSDFCLEEILLGDSADGGVLSLTQSRKSAATGKRRARVGAYEIAAIVAPLSDARFWRTKQVIFAARYVLVNCTGADLAIVQDGCAAPPASLLVGEQAPWHWPDVACARRLRLTTAGDFKWSGAFEIADLGETTVMLRSARSAFSRRFFTVRRVLLDGQTLVQFCETARPRLRIFNELASDALVSQLGTKATHAPVAVAPGDKTPFAWDEPCGEQALLVQTRHGEVEVRVEELGVEISISPHTFVLVTAQGATRNVYLRARDSAALSAVAAAAAVAPALKSEERAKSALSISLHSVGLSLVDALPQELLFVTIDGIHYDTTVSNLRETVQLTVENVQIDNQLICSPLSSIVLYHKPAKRKGGEAVEFLKLVMVRLVDDSIDHYEYVSALMQEIYLDVDEPLLLLLFSYLSNEALLKSSAALAPTDLALMPSGAPPLPPSGRSQAFEQPSAARMMYVALLHLNAMRVNVTFRASRQRSRGTDRGALEEVLRATGAVGLSNISMAPVRLNALIAKHVFSTRDDVLSRVITHWRDQVVRQLHRLLGASAAIGNPVGLISNLGAGVKDFFYEPSQGLVESPAAFGIGVARGTRSLIENTVYGIFNSVSGLTESAASAISTATFDERFMREREERRAANQPVHAGRGVLLGGLSVARGIAQGITGVITEPVRGAREGGVGGFFQGLGRGVVGVVVKPVVGVVDMASDLTAGVKNSTSIQAPRPLPRRWPRVCGDGRAPLQPYDAVVARGCAMLRSAKNASAADDVDDVIDDAFAPAEDPTAAESADDVFVAMWQTGTSIKRSLNQSVYTDWLVLSRTRLLRMRVKELDRANPDHAKYFHRKAWKVELGWDVPMAQIAIKGGWPRLTRSNANGVDGDALQFLVVDGDRQRQVETFIVTPRHDSASIMRSVCSSLALLQAREEDSLQ